MQTQRRHSVSVITICALVAIAAVPFVGVVRKAQKRFYGIERPTVEFRLVGNYGDGNKRPYDRSVNWGLRFTCDGVREVVPKDFSRSGVYRHEWPRACDHVSRANVNVFAYPNPGRCSLVQIERDVERPSASSPAVVWLTSVCMPERTASRAAPP